MYCPRCDKHFGEEYVVCPECGDTLRQESNNFETPVNNTFNGQVVEDKSVMFIILSVLQLFCCNTLTGIIGLILAIIGTSNFKKGDYAGATQMWKYTKITLWIGVALSVVVTILSFVFVGSSIAAVFPNLA